MVTTVQESDLDSGVERDSGSDAPRPDGLRDSILDTYFALRVSMSVLAFAFPLIFYIYWLEKGRTLTGLNLDSISAFYGTEGIARDFFVGILWAIASFLIGYKGFARAENVLLKAAGVCAALIATIPCTCWSLDPTVRHNRYHWAAAISFFALMALVMFFYAKKTINLLSPGWRAFFNWAYSVNAIALVVSVVIVFLLNKVWPNYTAYVFRVEWLGIWSFGAFWALKTWEYSKTNFEKRVASGDVRYHPKRGFVPRNWKA